MKDVVCVLSLAESEVWLGQGSNLRPIPFHAGSTLPTELPSQLPWVRIYRPGLAKTETN